jgi:CRISPR/Cas system-associated protein endoribonuclease Cas2
MKALLNVTILTRTAMRRNYDRVYEDEATTPLQRYIQITEKQINEKRELIAKLREKEQDVCRRID